MYNEHIMLQYKSLLEELRSDEIDKLSLKDQNDIAQNKYDYYKIKDPYPEISPALLNPYDIDKYINKTGMIFPYERDNLKTATYKIPLYGDIHYWENNSRKKKTLTKDKKDIFILKPNAIIYIHISTVFRVPYYIAFRFNLKIDLVHKGLLLGTGPVVDPGFQGRIMIPIHNLTANEYILRSGDGLIWVEFTKLSPFKEDKPFSEFKSLLNHTADDYFESANKLRSIQSAIPNAMDKAKEDAKQAKEEAEAAHSAVKLISFATVIAAVIAIGGIIYSGYTLLANVITPTISLVDSQKEQLLKNEDEIRKLNTKLKLIEEKLTKVKKNEE